MTSVDGHGAARPRNLDRRLLALVALVVGALVAGCSGSGGSGDEVEPVGAGAGRGGNDPSADDVEAVEDILAELLERHDEVVADAIADPAAATADGSELVDDLRALYSPGSAMPDQIVGSWTADAESGVRRHAIEDDYPAIASRLDGEVEVVSADEVRFPLCQELRFASYDADGNLVEMMPYREQPGAASAVRVDGDWLLVQLDTFEGQAACRAEGTEES
jgi:hypothetical protein